MPRGRPRKNREDDLLMKSAEFVGWALGGLEREIAQTRERLTSLTEQANKLRSRVTTMGGSAAASRGDATQKAQARGGRQLTSAEEEGGRKRRRRRRRSMSPEARARISEQMKKRWAERKRTSNR